MSSSGHVLQIGWHGHALMALQAQGREVTCVLRPRDLATAAKHGNPERHVVVPDTNNFEDVLSGVRRRGLDLGDFELVTSANEYCLVTASVLARLAGCLGMPVTAAVALRDKYVQKDLVRRAGLPVADCWTVDRLADVGLASSDRPLVVKPPAGAATRNTYLVRTKQDLVDLLDAEPLAFGGPWLVEEFVEGRELHIDGAVQDGRLALLAVSRYMRNVIAIQSGTFLASVVLRPAEHPGLYGRARELTAGVLAALGHHDGVFHLEAFLQEDGGLVFGECAGRVGGGMTRDAVAWSTGVDLLDAWAHTSLRIPFAPEPRLSAGTSGWLHVPAPAGTVLAVPTSDEAREQPGCTLAAIEVQPGSEMPDTRIGSDVRAGRVVIVGDDETHVEERIRGFVNWFGARVRTTAGPSGDE
ncbi:ATP-grasp domain-containing protein [Streptomyces sp. 4N509B]|uniref:ATP-grasp domain-containing protein n=1 Tax=Streptomyces sp. 4N509B TaxID=3457413 RepID=UPI003FD3F9C6